MFGVSTEKSKSSLQGKVARAFAIFLVLAHDVAFAATSSKLQRLNTDPDTLPQSGVYVHAQGSPLLPMLQLARKRIDIEIYTIKDPTVRALILSAQSRGVKVRILKDANPIGDTCRVFAQPIEIDLDPACQAQRDFLASVRAGGGNFEPFKKTELCADGGGKAGTQCYQHGKLALIDQLALLSTGNFDSSNLCINGASKCNRDYSVVLDEPRLVKSLQAVFDADWRGKAYDLASIIPKDLQEILTVSPLSKDPLLELISNASESLELQAQYINDFDLIEALKAAARRGVKVSLTVTSVCAFGRPKDSVRKKTEHLYGSLDRLGVSSAFFNASNRVNGKPGYMHAKVIVADGRRAWIGSVNGSTGSLDRNREFGVVFDDPTWIARTLKTVTEDHESPDSETWQQSLDCVKDYARG